MCQGKAKKKIFFFKNRHFIRRCSLLRYMRFLITGKNITFVARNILRSIVLYRL